MSFRAVIFTALFFGFSSVATYAETPWALGASAGLTHYNLENKDIRALLDFAGYDVDLEENDAGLKIWGTYQLNEFVVFEAQWLDLGEAVIDAVRENDEPTELGVSAEGLNLSVLLQAEVATNTDFFIKFGAFDWDLTVSGADRNSSGTNLSYGLGISHKRQWLIIKGEYESLDLDGLRVDFLSVGAGVTF